MINDKNWTTILKGVKACRIGHEFLFCGSKTDLKSCLESMYWRWPKAYICDHMFCYVSDYGVVEQIYTEKEAKRMLKIEKL